MRGSETGTTRKERPCHFVTFEGIDGSGKTTQLDRLARWLASRGARVLATREPGGGALGAAVRGVLVEDRPRPLTKLEELLLVGAARCDHVRSVYPPGAGRGHVGALRPVRRLDSGIPGIRRRLGARPLRRGDARRRGRHASAAHVHFSTWLRPWRWSGALRAPPEAAELDPTERLRDFDRIRRGFRTAAGSHPARCRLIDAGRPADVVAAEIVAHVEASGLLG